MANRFDTILQRIGLRQVIPTATIPVPLPQAGEPVADAFYYSPSGLGTRADKTRQVEIQPGCLDDREVADLMENDGLFATLLGRLVRDALRGGFSIKLKGEDVDATEVAAVNDRVRDWSIGQQIEQTWCQYFTQRNGFGGAVLLEITSDRDQSRPRLGQSTDPRFMSLAPGEISGLDFNITNPFSPNYQLPGRWQLNGYSIDPSWMLVGTTPKLYSTNLGVRYGQHSIHTWTGPSKARQFIEQIKQWGMSLQAATSALQTLSQLVLKSDTFRNVLVKSGTPSTDAMVIANSYWARISDLASRRSAMQPIGVGKDEEVMILSSTISGMGEILDRLMVAVAAAAEMPVTVAFGVSPGGFGTGESEQRLWSARVAEFRRLELTPVIKWTLERAFGDEAANWQICYEPIDSPTASEDADLRLKQAQIDIMYINGQVLQPNEVALSRFTGEYSTHTQIDVEARIEPLDLDEPEGPEAEQSEEPESEPDEPEDPEAEETDEPEDR